MFMVIWRTIEKNTDKGNFVTALFSLHLND